MRLFLDEDSQSGAIAVALRSAGHHVLTTAEAGRMQASDEEQLEFATLDSRTIVTANRGDFARLHAEYLRAGRFHAGILIREQAWSPGLLTRLIASVERAYGGSSLDDTLEFLSSWHDE